jgi:hypothetical protein
VLDLVREEYEAGKTGAAAGIRANENIGGAGQVEAAA